MGPKTLIRKHLFCCCQQQNKTFPPKKSIQGNSLCSLKPLLFLQLCHLKANQNFFVESSLDQLGSAFSLTNFRSLLCSWLSIRWCIRERNTYWIILLGNKHRQYGQYLALKRPYRMVHLLTDISYSKLRRLLLYCMTSFRNHSEARQLLQQLFYAIRLAATSRTAVSALLDFQSRREAILLCPIFLYI